MEIISTSKGKPCLLYEGYSYRQHRTRKDLITWVCLNEKREICRGRIISKGEAVIKVFAHQCAPNAAKNEVQKYLYTAKQRAKNEETPISKIYNQEIDSMSFKGGHIVQEMPSTSSFYRTLYRQRRKAQGSQVEPKSRIDVELNDELLLMRD